jgi:hypothetical protein
MGLLCEKHRQKGIISVLVSYYVPEKKLCGSLPKASNDLYTNLHAFAQATFAQPCLPKGVQDAEGDLH